jgi:hypoxanthine phosphoribosyltransferase
MRELSHSGQKASATSNSKYEAPGWDQIYEMLVQLAERIKTTGFKPEVIVGVSRGGWPPARVMSDLLENSRVANMKVEFYKDIGVRFKKPRITQPVTSEVKGRTVLVVDDVADTGHSLKVVADHLSRKGAKSLKVCTIYMKPQSVFRPDFYAKTTRKWIIFPWERLEAIRLIARRVGPDRAGPSVIARELKNSGIRPRLVRELWRILALDRRS